MLLSVRININICVLDVVLALSLLKFEIVSDISKLEGLVMSEECVFQNMGSEFYS